MSDNITALLEQADLLAKGEADMGPYYLVFQLASALRRVSAELQEREAFIELQRNALSNRNNSLAEVEATLQRAREEHAQLKTRMLKDEGMTWEPEAGCFEFDGRHYDTLDEVYAAYLAARDGGTAEQPQEPKQP